MFNVEFYEFLFTRVELSFKLISYDGPQGIRWKQKRCAANKKRTLRTKKGTGANKEDLCAANKKGKPLQTKMKTAAKKKTNAGKKKDLLQTENDRCKQKGEPLQLKKTGALQTKKEAAVTAFCVPPC